MVNPENLLTQIRPTEDLLLYEENWETLRQEFQNTPYFRALADAQTHANLLLDLRQSLMKQEKTGRELDFFSS